MEDLRERMPQDQREADQVDKEIAGELNKLSAEERESILLDIHGVSENQIDDDTVTAKLEEFHQELLLTENEAYRRALYLNRTFVEDPAFRLLFLRCARFDVKRAVNFFVLHFQVKEELFVRPDTDDILVRDVTWNDLDEHDRLVVSSGLFQVGSKRDVAGRTVLFFTPAAIQPSMKPENMLRAFWYISRSALKSDREMQQKGVVIVWINLRGTMASFGLLRQFVRIMKSIPFLVAAVHYGYQNPVLHPAVVGVRLLLFANASNMLFRLRFHFGNLDEISFELLTFGIPMDASPIRTPTGSDLSTGVSIDWHVEWLRTIRKLECKREAGGGSDGHEQLTCKLRNEMICIPSRCDVLFGKAKKFREHPGTLRCHYLVNTYRKAYEQASRRDKTRVADQILAIIEDSGGRFLRWNAELTSDKIGCWVVVEHEVAREKVSHMFRKLRERTPAPSSSVDGENENENASVEAPLIIPQIDALFAEERSRMSNPPESVQPQMKQRRILE